MQSHLDQELDLIFKASAKLLPPPLKTTTTATTIATPKTTPKTSTLVPKNKRNNDKIFSGFLAARALTKQSCLSENSTPENVPEIDTIETQVVPDSDAKKPKVDQDQNSDTKKPEDDQDQISDTKKPEDDQDQNSKTIFIGNLPKSTVDKKNTKLLLKLFSQFGPIKSIRFRSIAFKSPFLKKVQFIKKEFHESKDNVNAYIVFKNTESVQKALVLNGSLFNDYHIRVDTLDLKRDRKRTVFLGNLEFDISDEVVYRTFAECGDIEYVRIVRDKCGLGRGCGYVAFKERNGASLALKLDGKLVGKRNVRVTACKKAIKLAAAKGKK